MSAEKCESPAEVSTAAAAVDPYEMVRIAMDHAMRLSTRELIKDVRWAFVKPDAAKLENLSKAEADLFRSLNSFFRSSLAGRDLERDTITNLSKLAMYELYNVLHLAHALPHCQKKAEINALLKLGDRSWCSDENLAAQHPMQGQT